ncbi:MAG: TonB-dependent receptor, partial [Clostridia bacterium]|nr:TonB-dependent receptor [Clostridia bacterium]
LGWHGISGALPGDHVEAPSVAYTQKTMVSILGRLTYNYENKYYATINMREDASSRFSRNNRWGFFPSAAISWRVANENFWKNSTVLKNVINDLKIRASWGQVGNDQIADYQYFQFLKRFDQTATFTSPDGKPVTADPYQLALMSSDVKWETSSEWNIGLDINMFNNRLPLRPPRACTHLCAPLCIPEKRRRNDALFEPSWRQA